MSAGGATFIGTHVFYHYSNVFYKSQDPTVLSTRLLSQVTQKHKYRPMYLAKREVRRNAERDAATLRSIRQDSVRWKYVPFKDVIGSQRYVTFLSQPHDKLCAHFVAAFSKFREKIIFSSNFAFLFFQKKVGPFVFRYSIHIVPTKLVTMVAFC